jgi:hypothetical protein
MALSPHLSYGTVIGLYTRTSTDGGDDGRNPDEVPIFGLRFLFTPPAPVVRNIADGVTVQIMPVHASTNVDGILCGPDGQPGVILPASITYQYTPNGGTWSLAVSSAGNAYPKESFSFALAPSEQVNLSTVARLPEDPGGDLAAWAAAVGATMANVSSAAAQVDLAAAQVGLAAGHVSAADAARAQAVVAQHAAEAVGATTDAATAYLFGPGAVTEAKTALSKWFGRGVNVKDFGAVGDGVANDTAAIQAAIDSVADGGRVYIPTGRYLLTDAIRCVRNITIEGGGCTPTWGSQWSDGFNAIDMPIIQPYMTGTVLVQTTPAANGIELGGAGKTQHLKGFGIMFEGAHMFKNTGHGIRAVPTQHGAQYDMGVAGSQWDNIVVYGHDGNHYAYYCVNGIYNDHRALQSFGGGALYLSNDSSNGGHFGNTVFHSLYGQLFVKGTADGIRLTSIVGTLNMIAFVRPQLSITDKSVNFPTVTKPTATGQYMINVDATVKRLSFLNQDFETNVGATVRMPQPDHYWADPGGFSPETFMTRTAAMARIQGGDFANAAGDATWKQYGLESPSVAARVGDLIEVTVSGWVAPATTTDPSSWTLIDFGMIGQGGGLNRYFSLAGGSPATWGIGALRILNSRGGQAVSGTACCVVGEGDPVGGMIAINMVVRSTLGTVSTFRASYAEPFTISVKNLGPAR